MAPGRDTLNGSTTCQPARATSSRRKSLKKTWTGKAWKEARAGFIKSRGGTCEWCKSRERLTVHHPQRNSYGPEIYMDFALSECILLCARCHAALHAGRVICEREHDDGEIHYRWHDAEMCGFCFLKLHPEIKIAAEKAKKEKQKRQREARKRASDKAKAWKKNNGHDGKGKK